MSMRNGVWHALLAAGVLSSAMAMAAPPAFAGECPADKRGVNVREAVTLPAKGVTDTVLATTDLSKEKIGLKGHDFRLRRLVIEPGGVVPWHSHDERPAMIYIVQGTVHEYASTCAGPIEHKAGDVAREVKGVAHWWKNLDQETVILISVDILQDKNDKHM